MIAAIVGEVASERSARVSNSAVEADDLYQLLHLRTSRTASPESNERGKFIAEDVFGRVTREESGWISQPHTSPQQVTFEKAGLKIAVSPDDVLLGGLLRLPAIRDRYTPGFLALLSRDPIPEYGTRLYLGIEPSHAPIVGRLLADSLSSITSSYVVKALASASDYARSDAVTIFVPDESRGPTLEMLEGLEIEKYIKRGNLPSLFANQEPSGVCWMESAADASGGYSRAVCVARAINYDPLQSSNEKLADLIRHEFQLAGIDPDAPYRLSDGGP